MRDWNIFQHIFPRRKSWVCILPMRDWNQELYEMIEGTDSVCILPMRDWNLQAARDRLIANRVFVSYLWGIETYVPIFHFCLGKNPVCILPMRDWNCGYKVGNKWFLSVCILPMRDWNTVHKAKRSLESGGLYLTYEGLKPKIDSVATKLDIGLYLTYEGLKPAYRSLKAVKLVPFVSYLWGIETIFMKNRVFNLCQVCILPMRDWNNSIFAFTWYRDTRLYLTYEGLKHQSRFE